MSYNRGRGRGGYSNYNNRSGGGQHHQQNVDSYVAANSIPIEIMGWNGASLTECINFISRKCRVIVSNHSVDENTGLLKGYVKTEQQVNELLNWNGVRFAGQSLRFSRATNGLSNQMGGGGGAHGAASGGTQNTIETMTQFLKSRYQPEIKLLNLANVKQDPGLQSSGFFTSISVSSKFFPALMKIAGDLKLDVVSVDLSGNELADLQTISTMATTFPRLQNLSLQRNNFQRIRVFESWRHKLNFLRELILTENPIMNQTNPTEIQNIKLELMKSFPRLVVLNGEVLRNEQLLNTNLTFPFDSQQAMFFQDDTIRNISTNFIANYLKLWDSNRADLMVLYQNESQFSLQLDTSHPYLLETNNNYSSGTDFGYYMPHSRNLTRVSSSKSRMSKLAIGQEHIFTAFTQIPRSHHDILSKPEHFSMESFSYPALNGVMIIIHGSFDEVAQPDNLDHLNSGPPPSGPRGRYSHHNQNKNKKIPLSKKSFDRSFVVIPGPNGTMIVASDQLLVRPFTNSDAWNQPKSNTIPPQQQVPPVHQTPGTSPVPGVPVPGAPTVADLPVEVKTKLNPIQQELLVKILLETKLNITYGLMLCEQSNWDYQLCSINFKNSAATLPREAFVV